MNTQHIAEYARTGSSVQRKLEPTPPMMRKFASRLVRASLRLREGENVHVICGEHNLALAEVVAAACYKMGAVPFVEIAPISDRYSRLLLSVSASKIRRTPSHLLSAYDAVTSRIVINPVSDPSIAARIPEAYLSAQRSSRKPLADLSIKRKVKWVYIDYPTRRAAEFYGANCEEYFSMVWSALSLDYSELKGPIDRFIRRFQGTKQIAITSAAGTDLKFEVKGRSWIADDGVISDLDVKNGLTGLNLPSGEITIAPREDSADGVASFDAPVCYYGRWIRNLRLVFKDGRIVRFSAASGARVLRELLRRSRGDKDRIAEFSFGLNPELTATTGNPILDEKVAGTIHIAIGENRSIGGQNNSTVHWDFVMNEARVELDEVPVHLPPA